MSGEAPARRRFRRMEDAAQVHAAPGADLVAGLERDGPEVAAAHGLSSAAMRAGDLVRRLRHGRSWTQAELAMRVSVSQARIAEIEAGRGPQGPTWALMERIAEACGEQIGLVERPQPAVLASP